MTYTPLFKVRIHADALRQLDTVLGSGYIGQGSVVEELERRLEGTLGEQRKVLTTNSCTSALEMSLRLIGVGPHDEVVCTPMTCLATIAPILNLGAIIVWADIIPETGLIDPDDVMKCLTPNTKAIIAVDWGGNACDYARLREFGIPVIQDAAHSWGALINGHGPGVWGGDWVCYSFQAIKPLTTGDGGALVPPPGQYERAKRFRWFGLDRESSHSLRCAQDVEEIGGKYHMNDIAAAIGMENLTIAQRDVWTAIENAALLDEILYGKVRTTRQIGAKLPRWLYTVLVEDRERVRYKLAEAGFESSEVHRRCDHHRATNRFRRNLPGVDEFSRHQLNVPCGWWVSKDDIKRLGEALIDAAAD